MRTLHFYQLLFLLQVSLTLSSTVAGTNWITHNATVDSPTTERLPPSKKTLLDFVPSEKCSEDAGPGADLHEHIKPIINSAKLCPIKGLITSGSLTCLYANVSDVSYGHEVNVSYGHEVNVPYGYEVNVPYGYEVNVPYGHEVNVSYGYEVNVSYGHEVNVSYGYEVNVSYGYEVNVPYGYEVNVSYGHEVNVPYGHEVNVSYGHEVNVPYGYEVNVSYGHEVNVPYGYEVNVSYGHEVNVPYGYEVNVSYGHEVKVRDSSTYFDHQNVVILEDDPTVTESANFIFEKHPFLSTLLIYHKGELQVIRGYQTSLTRDSRVVLVCHGRKSSDGRVRLGNYVPQDLANIVVAMKIEDGTLSTISLVVCGLGRNLKYAEQLLRALRSLNVETKLDLRTAALAVSPSGQIATEEEGVWRYNDGSKKIIARLDQNGDLLTRVEAANRGQVILNFQGRSLYIQTLEWPTHPQMFVSEDLRKKYTSIDCLEGLTWSLFFEENERRHAVDYTPGQRNITAVWLPGLKPAENIPIKHIATILDLLVEIRYNAREDADFDLYYVLNDCIFQVQKMTFYASLVGKFIASDRLEEMEKFTETFKDCRRYRSLQQLRKGLKASEFNNFCRQTFQLQHCVRDCERWTHYFMAAVFTASVRNFRTFSLFLMTVIACEVSQSQGSDSPLCTAFVGDDHPMLGDDPWLERGRRGFYGFAAGEAEVKMDKRNTLDWLDQVVAKENFLYRESKRTMSGVDHDLKTELDIFGRVKVMNKYVFSSYLEFFRGTPEGKKLARGCRA